METMDILKESPHKFSLTRAIAILEQKKPVVIKAHLYFAAPTSEIYKIVEFENHYEIYANLFTLTGTHGPLQLEYSENILQEIKEGNRNTLDFLDFFYSKFIKIHYTTTQLKLSLIKDVPPILIPLLLQFPRNLIGLKLLIQGILHVPVSIVQFNQIEHEIIYSKLGDQIRSLGRKAYTYNAITIQIEIAQFSYWSTVAEQVKKIVDIYVDSETIVYLQLTYSGQGIEFLGLNSWLAKGRHSITIVI